MRKSRTQQISYGNHFFVQDVVSDGLSIENGGLRNFWGVLRCLNSAPFLTFFPILKKKIPIFKFLLKDWDFHSVNMHTSYMVMFSFNFMAIVCVKANLFSIDQKRT